MYLKQFRRFCNRNHITLLNNFSINFSPHKANHAIDRNAAREKQREEIMARGLPKVKPIPGVKNIILVASGKGGVGKSTTAVNLAAAFKVQEPNKNVGLLDADVFGPTIPLMMNLNDTPLLNDDNLMEPLMNYGVKWCRKNYIRAVLIVINLCYCSSSMSMGFLIEETAAVIWRGLMVMQALEKLMRQVHWGELDVLVIDTPPGTGDAQLSLLQNLPITGAILVTTPQSTSVQVTRRGAKLFHKLRVPIIGLVENMSSVKCPACRNDVQLFGAGVNQLADELDCKILASIPLEKEVSSSADKGVPIVISKPQSSEANSYKQLAQNVDAFIAKSAQSL